MLCATLHPELFGDGLGIININAQKGHALDCRPCREIGGHGMGVTVTVVTIKK